MELRPRNICEQITSIFEEEGDPIRTLIVMFSIRLDLVIVFAFGLGPAHLLATVQVIHNGSVLEGPPVLFNSSLRLELECIAQDEDIAAWVYNLDDADVLSTGRLKARPASWTTKALRRGTLITVDRFSIAKELLCRSVSNHSDSILVNLTLNGNNAQISMSARIGPDVLPTEELSSSTDCPIKLHVAQYESKYYLKCVGVGDSSSPAWKIGKVWPCYRGPDCANVYRYSRIPQTCHHFVNETQTPTETKLVHDMWWRSQPGYSANVIVCELSQYDSVTSWAIELFYIHEAGERAMHFSVLEVDPADWFWFDPPPKSHYSANESFATRCFAQRYANAEDPWIKVILNGSLLTGKTYSDEPTWDVVPEFNALASANITINFTEHGPGTYELICSARAWNTTEIRNRIATIIVRPFIRKDTPSMLSGGFPTFASVTIPSLAVVFALAFGLVYMWHRLTRLRGAVVNFLTDEEVKKFLQGKAGAGKDADGMGGDGQVLAIDCLPYNSEYEVPLDELEVDFDIELGSGHYGVVYMGRLRRTPVAVKTVRPSVPVEYFKALMSELKILAYIGRHDHIANLLGANSSNVKNRVLFVAVELCKISLLQELRERQRVMQGYTRPRGHLLEQETSFVCSNVYQNERAEKLGDLARWATEIGSGMEFLEEKRVVHGDLAARNVLLSPSMRVKICDFGLARQLIDYAYIRTQKVDLPWKWLAPESMSHSHFSTKSDVWAYGVTLWEIFSMGGVPYPGTNAWTLDFVIRLTEGARLPKPTYASDEVYAIMLKCWNLSREERPGFKELMKQVLESI